MWEKKERLKDRYTKDRIRKALTVLGWGYRKLSVRYKTAIAVFTFMSLIPVLTDLYNTWLSKEVVNAAIRRERTLFFHSISIYIATALFSLIYNAFYSYCVAKEKSGLVTYLRKVYYRVLLNKEYGLMERFSIGQLHQRLQTDVPEIANQIFALPAFFLNLIIQMTGSAILIFMAVPEAGLLAIPLTLTLSFITYYLTQKMKGRSKLLWDKNSLVNSLFIDHLEHMIIFRAFGKEDLSYTRLSDALDDARDTDQGISRINAVYSNMLSALMMTVSVGSMFYFLLRIMDSRMSFGTYAMIVSLVGRLRGQMTATSLIIPKLYNLMIASEKIYEIDEWPDDLPRDPVSKDEILEFYDESFVSLRFDNVSFAYPGNPNKPIFRNFDMTVEKGDYVAISGPSGCGKSTFQKLLLGLYRPDSGEIWLDTEDGKVKLDPSWRTLFAYVPQNNHLIMGTIKEALSFGEDDDDDRHYWDALKIACADSFVKDLPEGLSTPLGAGITALSEGQIQRLAIARAIFSKRPILLLDECTNSLDEETEKQLLENLRAMTDKTVIIVSHKPAVPEYCDKVIRLDFEHK